MSHKAAPRIRDPNLHIFFCLPYKRCLVAGQYWSMVTAENLEITLVWQLFCLLIPCAVEYSVGPAWDSVAVVCISFGRHFVAGRKGYGCFCVFCQKCLQIFLEYELILIQQFHIFFWIVAHLSCLFQRYVDSIVEITEEVDLVCWLRIDKAMDNLKQVMISTLGLFLHSL